jgi:hypothetical protein
MTAGILTLAFVLIAVALVIGVLALIELFREW